MLPTPTPSDVFYRLEDEILFDSLYRQYKNINPIKGNLKLPKQEMLALTSDGLGRSFWTALCIRFISFARSASRMA